MMNTYMEVKTLRHILSENYERVKTPKENNLENSVSFFNFFTGTEAKLKMYFEGKLVLLKIINRR